MSISLQDLLNMESRILKTISSKFEDHEKTEKVRIQHVQKLLTRHDVLLVGLKGDNGLVNDMTVLKTKVKVWYGVFTVILSGGGLTVVYMIFSGV